MNLAWGITLVILCGFAWIGQIISAIWPARAAALGIRESVDDVDPAFYADAGGEALWDIAILWILPTHSRKKKERAPWHARSSFGVLPAEHEGH